MTTKVTRQIINISKCFNKQRNVYIGLKTYVNLQY